MKTTPAGKSWDGFDQRPLSFLMREARKYLDLSKQDLILGQRWKYVEITETLLRQADTYMNAIKEISIHPVFGQFNSLKWKIYKFLFGDPYITIKTRLLHRNGIITTNADFNLFLGKDTLTYKINVTDEEEEKGYDTEL